MERTTVTRDSSKEERDRVIAEKQKRRAERKEKIKQLIEYQKRLIRNYRVIIVIPKEIHKELLGKLEDTLVNYEAELECLDW